MKVHTFYRQKFSRLFIFTAFILGSLNSFAIDTNVFMVENSHGKHIYSSTSNEGGNTVLNKITSGDFWHLYPDISADGSWLTYVQGQDPTSLQVIVKNKITNQTEQWTHGSGMKLHPRFSRNGDRLFFSMQDLETGKNNIFYMDIKQARQRTRPTRKLIDGEYVLLYQAPLKRIADENNSFFPAPSADGTFLYYQRTLESKEREIVYFNIDTKEKKVFASGMAPALSKDEKFVAFTRPVEGDSSNWDIWVADRFSDKKNKVTLAPSRDYAPAFDAHGNLYFASDRVRGDNFTLFKIPRKNWFAFRSFPKESIELNLEGSLYAVKYSGNTTFTQSVETDILGDPRSSFGAIEHKGRVYIAGGHQGAEHTYPPESFTNRVEYYSIKEKKWYQAAPRVHKCHGFQLAAYGDYIYAFGGFAYDENNSPKWKSLDVIERYSIKENKWEVVGQMPRRRSSNVVAQVGELAYLIGGWDATPKFSGDLDGTFHSEIDVVNLRTLEIKTLNTLLPKKRRAFTAIVNQDKVLLIGGISEGASHFSLLDEVTEFDTSEMTFEAKAKLPFATFAPAAGLLKGKLYVFGGMFKTGEWNYEYVPHIFEYSFKEKAWNHTGRYLQESKGFSQVVTLPKGQNKSAALAILGGHTYQDNTDSPVNTFEVFK